MFSEAKVTEIHCMADDFCKEFAIQQEKYMIKDTSHTYRNKPNRMSDAKLWLFSSCFIPAFFDVSNTIIRNMSVSI